MRYLIKTLSLFIFFLAGLNSAKASITIEQPSVNSGGFYDNDDTFYSCTTEQLIFSVKTYSDSGDTISIDTGNSNIYSLLMPVNTSVFTTPIAFDTLSVAIIINLTPSLLDMYSDGIINDIYLGFTTSGGDMDSLKFNIVMPTPILSAESMTICPGVEHEIFLSAIANDTSYQLLNTSWNQTSGTTISFDDTTSSTPLITIPALNSGDSLVFEFSCEINSNTNGSFCVATRELIIYVDIYQQDTSISLSGNVFTANLADVSYQWFDCDSNSIIAGEINQNLSVPTTGSYAVILTNGLCIDTSSCHFFSDLGEDSFTENSFHIYPNPVKNILTITGNTKGVFTIISVSGKAVKQVNKKTYAPISLPINDLSNGIYFIKNIDSEITLKLIIE